jgi:hypothetical protein
MARLRQRGRAGGMSAEDGNVTMQNLIWMPTVFLLIFAFVQFGLWFHAGNIARTVANDAVQVARIEGGTEAGGRAEAAAGLAAIGGIIIRPTVDFTCDSVVPGGACDAATATTVTVRVSGFVQSFIPGITLPVNQAATGSTERFVSP